MMLCIPEVKVPKEKNLGFLKSMKVFAKVGEIISKAAFKKLSIYDIFII